jgi:hypothetical protein
MARGVIPCDTRPDCDNLCKILFDAMTRLGFWGDDSQIADLRFVKCWGDTAGIGVMADEISDATEAGTQEQAKKGRAEWKNTQANT